MEERAVELLAMEDSRLFAHGGCHVFALALREFTGLPLLWVRERGGAHDHLGCQAQDDVLLDIFGCYTLDQYIREERLDAQNISFEKIDEAAVRSRFIQQRGKGYYAHPDFFNPAMARARAWIAKHKLYFDGSIKGPIPGLSRLNRLGKTRVMEALGKPPGG